jgi:hypothetical protein
MVNSLETLNNSLYWQQVVLQQSKDKAQIERVKKAIEKLNEEITQIENSRMTPER